MNDIAIARAASLKPISQVGEELGIPEDAIEPFGRYKAKISNTYLEGLADRPQSKLILVTAISPTAAGEGKTTTTVGLGDALSRIGKKTAICLREPSLGPCFGLKGGAAGGGHAQVVPMEDINLHFTGDFHAITSAHNLLSAMIDNHIYWGNALEIDQRRIVWRRVEDMNDRALREITTGLGGIKNGHPATSGFDITVASEVMAILCLAENLSDLEERLGDIVVAHRRDKSPVTARDLNAHGAMTVLLKEALQPNLVQTLENTPALIHGGPFANIAHGCNSVIATKAAMKLADFVVTEAGFGADLGAEKFFNIKCRSAGLKPQATVVVATVRALKMHGGVAKDHLDALNQDALRAGCENLKRHIRNMQQFGVPVVVAINQFTSDQPQEFDLIREAARNCGADTVLCSHWAEGSKGTEKLAEAVVALMETTPAQFEPLYTVESSIEDKLNAVATRIYGAEGISLGKNAKRQIKETVALGKSTLPVCIAKTPYSFSTDPKKVGAPSDHTLDIRELRLSAGARFIVALTGDIMTMPGLPKRPAAERIRLDENGQIEGLF
ncbi:formate--tetrahydrofolate ligase [Pseudovibrio exalbescens]|uniref:formate--tetrahydrofolate ligase n=1 Tax=Pseudovibrio exalbescens TaxID=197461 RepID=UPI002365D9D2|nr:formate--tetrahydrofolate ligase [Pseudovibrio exalbescens]MDD7908874.1 formate--tetrahydrofolate ligase [Pseudovibrio exalbescens]